jgi:hypothetical protein
LDDVAIAVLVRSFTEMAFPLVPLTFVAREREVYFRSALEWP